MNDKEPSQITPEQRLFVGVIANAAQEAAGVQRVGGDTRTIRQSARAWFRNAGDDFRTVCELAGFEPNSVRKQVLAYLDRVDADPAALVKLKRINAADHDHSRNHGVSITDVARRAGLSPATVSNVIHERKHVAPKTRARVLAAINELGYNRRVH